MPLVKQYSWPVDTMLAIMAAESGCNPQAVNTANSDGSTDTGLMQINSIHGLDPETLMYPTENIRAAYRIYQTQGLKVWSVYSNGKYKQFMKE